MENEHGGRDVISRAISARMRVPVLDDLRQGLTEDEYRSLLELSQTIVESTKGSSLPAWLIGLAFVAAAEMYMAALDEGAAIMGRGPGSN
jgi:hypothetical protein